MRFFGVLFLLCLVVVPCVAEIPWCGQQDMFLWNATSDVSGYRVMENYPQLANQYTIVSPLVSSTSGEVTVGTWLTPIFDENKTLEPGLWRFHVYAKASSDAGLTSLRFRTFNRSSDGTITWLFFGNAFSGDISGGTVPKEYWVSYARRNYTQFFSGDRLGVQINVTTDNAATCTVSLDVAGNTNASLVQSSYWACQDEYVSASARSQATDSSAIGIVFGLLGGLVGGLIIYRGDKKV